MARKAEPFDHPEWIYELEHDGFRAVAEVENGRCSLFSRNGHPLASFSELATRISFEDFVFLLTRASFSPCLSIVLRLVSFVTICAPSWPLSRANQVRNSSGEAMTDRPSLDTGIPDLAQC